MPSDLTKYLATHYLVPDSSSPKKRKRKHLNPSGLLITDDDDSTWTRSGRSQDAHKQDGLATVSATNAEFRKVKKSNWTRIGAGGDAAAVVEGDEAGADTVLAAAAAENEAARAEDEDCFLTAGSSGVALMNDGTHAGLQTAAVVSAQLKRRQRQELREFEQHRKSAKEADTVYRDATGRRIDISMRRAEARRTAVEAEKKEQQARDALKGAVQLEEARKRKEMLLEARVMSFTRTANDEQMNRELKEKERWNDPMANFLGRGEDTTDFAKVSKGRRPTYTCTAPPNRYGVKPGYRWDGVDRGNGFEAERFRAMNTRERNRALAYTWQLDE